MAEGLVSDIQRFCLHDGPGIRTVVFLKGCPLRCFWCHNPETWSKEPQLRFSARNCRLCGRCGTVEPDENGAHRFRPYDCPDIEACAQKCAYGALEVVGCCKSPRQVAEELLPDADYYAKSGGGVTLSGGEPLMQPDFCRELLGLCRNAGIHTAIETSGFGDYKQFAALLPFLSLIIMDVKQMDDDVHRRVTGVSNKSIIENAERLAAEDISLIIRTPVIPGVNDSAGAIGEIAGFIKDFPNLSYYELMQYHNLGEHKYDGLGLAKPHSSPVPPNDSAMEALRDAARKVCVAQVRYLSFIYT